MEGNQDLLDKLSRISYEDDPRQYLKKVKTVYAECSERRDELMSELYFQNSELPLTKVTLANMRQELSQVRLGYDLESTRLNAERKQLLQELQERSPSVITTGARLNSLEQRLLHHRHILRMCDLDGVLQKNLKEKDWLNVRAGFLQLLHAAESQRRVDEGGDERLMRFTETLAELWRQRLHSTLQTEVDGCLEKLGGWPFETPRDCSAHKVEIQNIRLVLDVFACSFPVDDQDRSSCSPLVKHLFDAFELRFRYHFYGEKKTNAASKPEWFFTQLLKWAKLHSNFFQTVLQPILNDLETVRGRRVNDAYADFLHLLMELAREKVGASVKQCMADGSEPSFTHLIDETIIFEMEFAAAGYDEAGPNCLDVFTTQRACLERWLRIEWECHREKVDHLLVAVDAWTPRYQSAGGELDLAKVPECADEFVILLQLITERYRLLRSVVARVKFLQLQLDLLDDFRLRLIQIYRNLETPWSPPYSQLMNAFWYIAGALSEWDDSPFFIQLQGVRKGAVVVTKEETSEIVADISEAKMSRGRLDGAFEVMSELFMHSWHQMKSELLKSLQWDLRSAIRPYKEEKWFALETGAPPTNITASFCPFLLQLRERASAVETDLGVDGFQSLLSSLVKSVFDLYTAEILQGSAFSQQGAMQIEYDVTSALVPLVNSYRQLGTAKVAELDANTTHLVESLKIISLPKPTALLLKDAIMRDSTDLTNSLAQDFDVYILDRIQIGALLNKRVDLNRNM